MRELTRAEIDELLHEQVVGRIGCHADGVTYVVPVIYAYDGECVHVASIEGRKVRMMRENPNVCFEVDEYAAPGQWRSAIAQGAYEEAEGDEQAVSLALLAERFARGGESRRTPDRPDTQARQTVCFRIHIREATGRAVSR
ncbi:MAG TPA: pyridoxamine 5'-phosphate oxidase family protein [Gaiellaceae bacterium]|nr:pyridoxamine 5'-phosphate oxidase family protein [Gaiellaceae bacterium]